MAIVTVGEFMKVLAGPDRRIYVRVAGSRERNIPINHFHVTDAITHETINQDILIEYEDNPAEIFIIAINIDTNGRESTEEDQREA